MKTFVYILENRSSDGDDWECRGITDSDEDAFEWELKEPPCNHRTMLRKIDIRLTQEKILDLLPV